MTKLIVKREAKSKLVEFEQSELLTRIFENRGVTSKSELELSLKHLSSYKKLKGIALAVDLLVDAIKHHKKIVIVGDFDVDGATSTTLCVLLLRQLGASDVNFVVPNRFEFGYGLSPEIVEVVLKQHPDLIMTVDNGVASIEGVALAKSHGVKVLVTDHHLAGDELPDADAIVNPNQPGCEFENKSACGCAVAFYVMAALRAKLIEIGFFDKTTAPNISERLDLVALATIADVVPLVKDNRIFVQQGLARIRQGKCLQGIKSIVQIAGKDIQKLVSSDFGFVLGPRLNAAGRLDDISLGINCLLETNPAKALEMASELNDLNQERKQIELSMQQQALSFLEKVQTKDLPIGVCLFQEDWHEGVIGILASRIKERLHRPVIIFAGAQHGMIKGSARSIDGFHIRDGLDLIAKKYPHVLTKFGGHAMAAGLSIKREHFELFQQAFNEVVSNAFDGQSPTEVLYTDGKLDSSEMTLQVAELLKSIQPWGQGFPSPSFDSQVSIISQRIVGKNHLKLVLQPDGTKMQFDAICFNVDLNIWPNQSPRANVVYQLDINDFRSQQSVQWMVQYIEIIG
ncbi:MAG: single-stranded-DNA-specific exonuclease RecJ [Saccharospirillaceae bacterium]|nr:single-stranded-DNA-specific exonuclease RecJ [Pseudomonadales bacterium]NRB81462.1 single-stranded-DNA-specific exonuclease RecJ [Saccharospirillaceae bacterium]